MAFLDFLAPPAEKQRLPEERIDKEYRAMRIKVFLGAFLGYAGYYLVRKNLSLAAPDMIQDGLIDKGKVGIAMSAVSIAYAFSKFIMGAVSDRSDARKFLVIGLILSAITMIGVGIFPFQAGQQALNATIIFILMLIVGWLSGMGWPPCGRIMAHWFSQNERSFKMSVWNTSHTIGSGSLGILAMIGVAMFAGMGMGETWRANFIVPSAVAILIAVFCWWAIRDTPESCGLPSVQDWRKDFSGVKTKSNKTGEKLPFKTLFVEYVVKNRLLWVVAISNVLVYMVRYGISDWCPTYLQEAGIMDKDQCKVAFSVHNYVGAIGTIFMGWVSAKFFKGRCAPPNVICMAMVLIGTLLYWQAGSLSTDPMIQKTIVYTALIIIGFFIYGPVALIGVQALNTVPKNAAGTAAGFVGLFGYLIGDSLLSKIFVGKVAESSWNTANLTFVIASVVGVILCALMWRHEGAEK